ncbi:MAG: hypothetical protein LBT85_00975 [Bifidobacteriaceae bacterium]|jgi:hypothetical protein|nr:hypothetical protein [Bifidobacteriaceae bacterium]
MLSEKVNKYCGNCGSSKRPVIANIAKKNIPNILQLKYELEDHEIEAYNDIASAGAKLRLIPKSNKGLSTNDFIFSGKQWEMKNNNTKYKTIRNSIKKSIVSAKNHNVVKENFIEYMGNHKLSDKLKDQLGLYNFRNPNYKIKNLLIFSKRKFIKIKLK